MLKKYLLIFDTNEVLSLKKNVDENVFTYGADRDAIFIRHAIPQSFQFYGTVALG